MLYRIGQFLKGLTAHIPLEGTVLLDRYLNRQERKIFMELPKHERRHAIATAFSVINLSSNSYNDTMIKAALLHDIGKIKAKTGIIKKSVLVLMDRFLPSLSNKLSESMKMFYIYYNHPEVGADILKTLNTEDGVVDLVRYHHSDTCRDIEHMDILKKADSLN